MNTGRFGAWDVWKWAMAKTGDRFQATEAVAEWCKLNSRDGAEPTLPPELEEEMLRCR